MLSQFNDTAYIYTYGGIQNDVCNQIKPTYDGGYIMIGTTNSFGCGNTSFYVIKTDSLCNHQWSRTYSGAMNQEGFSVATTFDKGYAFLGFTDSYGAGGYDVLLVKTDSLGKVQWQKTYGGSDWDFGYSLQQLPDSGFIMCGLTYSFGPGNGNVYVIRIDKNGDTLWTRAIGGEGGYSIGNSICVHEDSLYAIIGATTSFGIGDTNIYFILMDSKGMVKKYTTYGSTNDNVGNSIRGTVDRGFIVFGSTDSVEPGKPDEMLLKLDSMGDMQWMQIYHLSTGRNIGKDAIQAPDSSYLAVSASNAGYGLGPESMRIWHINIGGVPLSGPSFGGTGYQLGTSIALAKNGNAVFVGATNSLGYTQGVYDVYVVRLKNDSVVNNYTLSIHLYKDTCLCIPTNTIDQATIHPGIKIFPNPVKSSSTILVQGIAGASYLFNIYNVFGQCIVQNASLQPIGHEQSIAHIEKGGLASGIYICKIINQSGITVATSKFIIE